MNSRLSHILLSLVILCFVAQDISLYSDWSNLAKEECTKQEDSKKDTQEEKQDNTEKEEKSEKNRHQHDDYSGALFFRNPGRLATFSEPFRLRTLACLDIFSPPPESGSY